jgi:hypothetical protein
MDQVEAALVYPAFYALMLRASKDAPPGNERGREGGLRRREAGAPPRQPERERGGRPPQATREGERREASPGN